MRPPGWSCYRLSLSWRALTSVVGLALAVVPAATGGRFAATANSPIGAEAVASFDDLDEGFGATSFTDGGITFFGLHRRLPGGGESPFAIDRADDDLGGFPGFTPPNALGFGGYSPGGGVAYTRVGSFGMSTRLRRTNASLELFVFDSSDTDGNTVALQALRNGQIVASDSVTLSGFGVHHYTLSLQDVATPFNRLRLLGQGDKIRGVFFGVVDTVRISG